MRPIKRASLIARLYSLLFLFVSSVHKGERCSRGCLLSVYLHSLSQTVFYKTSAFWGTRSDINRNDFSGWVADALLHVWRNHHGIAWLGNFGGGATLLFRIGLPWRSNVLGTWVDCSQTFQYRIVHRAVVYRRLSSCILHSFPNMTFITLHN